MTAVLFLMSGLGLFCAILNKTRGLFFFGGVTLAFSAIIAVEYISGLDFSIDQLFLEDYIHPETAHPGRPAPNTVLAFLCIGFAEILLGLNRKRQSDIVTATVEVIGFVVFVLGAHALGGYIQSVEIAYAWGTDTRMSIHTAISNAALGFGLLAISWSSQSKQIFKVPLWVPFIICFLALQVDLVAPPEIIASIVYIPLVFCSVWFILPRTAFTFAIIATLLAVLRYLLFPEVYMTEENMINRLLTIGAIWFVAILVFWQRVIDRKLERSENYLKSILDHTIEGLIVTDSHGTIKNYNRACEKIFGYTADEVIGKKVTMLLPPYYRKKYKRRIEDYLVDNKASGMIAMDREVEGLRKDGTSIPINVGVNEMRVEGERFFSGIVRDITKQKQAEAELLRSNTELERFAFVAAHDLQEPLRIVITSTDIFREECEKELSEQSLEFIVHAQNAAKRMRALIKDLLEYSRIDNEYQGCEPVSLTEIVNMALENLNFDIRKTGAQIQVDTEMPVVNGNPVQLLRLYQNLIGNSIKYRNKDIPPQIHIKAKKDGMHWILSVEDNGIGIEQEYLEKIFSPFIRLHTATQYPGTGIGLAMCRRIVESHKGKIWALSTVGKGSSIFFSLLDASAELSE
ncbi:MAG: PAS domain S-box protein [Rhodospirillales bacterium]|nr:PAS domain S-box protein [Rhodospirillales bacterium]